MPEFLELKSSYSLLETQHLDQPLDRWLMKSFPHNSIPTNKQKTFNYLIFRACTKTENTFGCLKARWRKLMKQNEY